MSAAVAARTVGTAPAFGPVLAHLEARGVLAPRRAATLLPLLLGSALNASPPAARHSGLNPDGVPLQLCVSAREGAAEHVLIGDPCADLVDAVARQRGSVECARALLRQATGHGLAAAVEATLAAMLPAGADEQRARRMGVLWLAAGLETPSYALYTGASWGAPVPARWSRIERWLAEVLPDPRPAVAVVQTLRAGALPESACIEGAGPARARAKIYFRLDRPPDDGALAALGLDDERVFAFLADALGERAVPPGALVFSIAFDLATGEPQGAKVDLCGHCVVRPSQAWQGVLRRAQRAWGIDAGAAIALLQAPGIELACIGAGLDRARRLRINTYAKPVRPPSGIAPA